MWGCFFAQNSTAYNPCWVLIGFFDLLMTCKVAEISGCIAFDIIHGKDEVKGLLGLDISRLQNILFSQVALSCTIGTKISPLP